MQDYIYLIIIGVLFILSCALAGSRAKAVREKKAKAKELEDSLLNLDAVYSEVNTTQEELNAKYRELKDSEAKIKKLAYEDSLTGLPNKAAFMEVLGSALSTLRKNENIAVMHLDLDDFKEINGMWGEPLGDELILDISHRLKSNLDENDYLARSGSDEFYILTQNIEDIDAYEERVKKVQNTFRFPFMLSVNEFVITVSIGVAVAPRDGKSVATMLKHSDSALAEAKWLGKNTYCYYTEVIAQKEIEELELKSELTTAISEGTFFMEYQTVNEVQSGDLRALRVSLKWDRKEKGIWNAGKFTGFAERSGQIIPIGEYVLAGCCDEIKRREEAGEPKVPIILPITRRQFINQNFESAVLTILEEKKVDISNFIFEVDEKLLIKTYEDYRFLMNELAASGFRFRLGNFGAGMMSIRAVRELPVNIVAVSYRSIFADHDPEEGERMLKLITTVIDKMGREVVIANVPEGEEEKVASLGFKYVQGNLREN